MERDRGTWEGSKHEAAISSAGTPCQVSHASGKLAVVVYMGNLTPRRVAAIRPSPIAHRKYRISPRSLRWPMVISPSS